MPSTPCTNQRGTTFSLRVTLGYGTDNKTEENLNKACSKQTFGLSDIASNFFFGSASSLSTSFLNSSNNDLCNNCDDQDKFFLASASNVRLIVSPSEKFWKTNSNLITVFMPPNMITSALEKHFSSNKITSGSSFWINPPSSTNFANDLLPKIHQSALTGCKIRGIVLTSIAAKNGPAELLILEVPKGRSIHDHILRVTNGCTIAEDPERGILKILPLSTVNFTHENDNLFEAKNSGKRMGQPSHCLVTDTVIPSNTTRITPEIPTCPVCLHRIDPIRLGLPGPCVQQLCSKFCPSPSLMVRNCSTEEETCHKQRFLVSTKIPLLMSSSSRPCFQILITDASHFNIPLHFAWLASKRKWAIPARCKACQVIELYWDYSNSNYGEDEDRSLFCGECSMHKTLWTW